MQFPLAAVSVFILDPTILLSTLLSDAFNLFSFFNMRNHVSPHVLNADATDYLAVTEHTSAYGLWTAQTFRPQLRILLWVWMFVHGFLGCVV